MAKSSGCRVSIKSADLTFEQTVPLVTSGISTRTAGSPSSTGATG